MKRICAFVLLATLLLCAAGCQAAAWGAGTENLSITPAPETPVEFCAQYIRTDGYEEGAAYPGVSVIRSREELEAYCEANGDTYDLGRRETVYSDTTIGFADACDRYDEAYFETNCLVLVRLEEGSGSIRHAVRSVVQSRQGRLAVAIDTKTPQICTDDMAQWHIVLELPRDTGVQSEKDILVYLDGDLRWDGASAVRNQPESVLEDPPVCTLFTPEGEYPLVKGGYSWTYFQGEQMCAVIADQAGRPLGRSHLEVVSLGSKYAERVYVPAKSGEGYEPSDEIGYFLKLSWPVSPDEVTVTCWQESVWEGKNVREEAASVWDVSAFYAKPGGYVYEIKANWKDRGEGFYGSANYYGYIRTPDHGHQLAEEPQTVKDPFVGYCGNTRTTLYAGDKSWSFMFGNSVALTDILLNLDYRRGMTCRCMAEYTVDTEFGLGYEVNLTEGFARCEKGQASLTPEQVERIGQIIHWAVTTDCQYPVE